MGVQTDTDISDLIWMCIHIGCSYECEFFLPDDIRILICIHD